MQHIPVLLKEVVDILNPRVGDHVLDCTVGLGGHAKAFLENIGSKGFLVGIDADGENLKMARENLKEDKNVKLVQGNFRVMVSSTHDTFDIIFADLGLSSPHIDDPTRGFTYREDGPLDLRFDQTKGLSGAQLIAQISEKELADVLWQYGEIKSSRRLACAIKEQNVQSTLGLKKCAEDIVGRFARKLLPQIFQALRIAVNDELGSLNILLQQGPSLLNSGGRMGIISYHSLEDRMVKQSFRALDPSTYQILTKKPICPSEEEVKNNPRSRSAKFRVIQRVLE
ncbi:16S rRNA (cytosine(1402)-N(4))-methyltransferase RsmH [Candidatus Peregrinibacteria bacterium]|nr:16S rRNA (cytosine(1402)-N(4))-methyltransferase RsmH [Candidatus Peregrinibacteria bacterium]